MGAVMLRTTNPQRSLWEAILPAEAIGLSTELTMVDRLLDDPVFIQPSGSTSTRSSAAPRSPSRPTCG
jgi:hypothetical protein